MLSYEQFRYYTVLETPINFNIQDFNDGSIVSWSEADIIKWMLNMLVYQPNDECLDEVVETLIHCLQHHSYLKYFELAKVIIPRIRDDTVIGEIKSHLVWNTLTNDQIFNLNCLILLHHYNNFHSISDFMVIRPQDVFKYLYINLPIQCHIFNNKFFIKMFEVDPGNMYEYYKKTKHDSNYKIALSYFCMKDDVYACRGLHQWISDYHLGISLDANSEKVSELLITNCRLSSNMFMYPIKHHNDKLAKLLIHHYEGYLDYHLLIKCIEHRSVSVFMIYKDKVRYTDEQQVELLIVAAKYRINELFEHLFDQTTIDPVSIKQIFKEVIECRNWPLVRKMIQAKINDLIPIHINTMIVDQDTIDLLIKYPLHYFSMNDMIVALQSCIILGLEDIFFKLYHTFKDGLLPNHLHKTIGYSAEYGQLGVFKILYYSVQPTDDMLFKYLCLAVRKNRTDVALFIIQQGRCVEMYDRDCHYLLRKSLKNDNKDLIKIFYHHVKDIHDNCHCMVSQMSARA